MLKRNIPSVSAVVALLIIWQLLCTVGVLPSYMLPSPIEVVQAFVTDFQLLLKNSVITLQEAFIGLILGVSVGFCAAMLMDSFNILYKAFYPLLIITQTIPSVAIAPLLVLWFGYEMTPKIVLIVISTFFPVTVGLLDGFRSADKDAIGLLRSMGANRMQIFRYIKFPSALPQLFSGLRIAAAYSVVGAVIQHNTSGIISRKGEGMNSPKGLEGKKYATWDMDVEKETIREVMKADGGNFDLVKLIPSTVTDEVSALKSGSVDAIWIFYGWAGVACETAGLETDYFEFADINPVFDYYTPVIIGNNAWLEENPETAKAFIDALSKGYTYAVENPKNAADILMDAAPELKSNSELVYASQEYLASEYISDASTWGEFNPDRWASFYNWLNEKSLLEEKINPDFGFTNDYLPK